MPEARRRSAKELAGQHVKRTKGLKLTVEERVFWREYFDTRKTSIRTWIEGLEIKTDVDVADDEPLYVPFVLRPAQARILEAIERAWSEGRSARLVILKGRRQGCSMFIAALFLERILRVPGWECMFVAQDMDTSRYINEKIREFLSQIPAKALQAAGLTIVESTRDSVRIQHGSTKISQIKVVTARRRALGRGRGNNGIAATEFPVWPDEAKADLSGILPTCRDVPGNIVIFESTARGYEEFRDRYYSAKEGRSGYDAIFLSAQDHPDARRPLETQHHYDWLEENIGQDANFGGNDEMELFSRILSELGRVDALDFMSWYRHVLHDECAGSIELMRREYPTTEDEAFTGSGRPVFPLAMINSHMKLADAREKAALVARIDYGSRAPRLESDKHGAWTIFEMPREGEAYTFFADVASGYERQADGKRQADWSTITIKHILTRKTVARYRAHIFPTDFAHEVFKGACFYGTAKGFVERNMDGGTVIAALEEIQAFGVWGHQIMLTVPRIVRLADGRKSVEREVGFKTSMKTKPRMIDMLLQHLRDYSPPNRTTPFDILTLKEMQRYERDEKGRTAAATGHDDLVISEAGSLWACLELHEEVPVLSKVNKALSNEDAAYARMFASKTTTYGSSEQRGFRPELGEGF